MSPSFALLRLSLALLPLAPWAAQAQSSCASDGQPRPLAVLERFINADCDTCWSDAATPAAGPKELALDWIVPGSKGEDAPLSAAANADGLARLQALGRPVPAQMEALRSKAGKPLRKMRVAHGLPFNGYVGASIELRPGRGGPWNAWLLLVETIPAGTEGSPVARHLVRNMLQPPWNGPQPLSRAGQLRLFESRPLSIPEGANPQRLRVVGLLEDAQGHLVAATISRCAGQP